MSPRPEKVRAWLPSRLVTRGALLVTLSAASVAVPSFFAYRALSECAAQRAQYESEALLAATLAAQLEAGAGAEDDSADWLQRVAAHGQRLRWAAVYGRDGQGVEFRRRTAFSAQQISSQLDLACTTPQRKPLMLDGVPSARFELLTLPLPSEGATLAVILDWGAAGAESYSPVALLVGLACVGFGGLGLAWMLFRSGIEQPIRLLGDRLADVQAGLSDAAVNPDLPAELAGLAQSISEMQTDLRKWRVEATYWRHSVDTAVDARTRQATRAAQRAEREADTDALTRLGNRRMLERELPRLLQVQQVAGGELSLIVIDVNNFKLLNDARGHQAGDQLLTFIGELIRATTRRGLDLAARYGGDEFIIAMPGASTREAVEVARRTVSLFAQRVRTLGNIDPPPGLSAGVASMRQHGAFTAEALLKVADEAMYWAKRNRLGVATIKDVKATK